MVVQLDTARNEQQIAEAAFKHRYSVTHPAEAPAKPKRPVGLIATLVGAVATLAARAGGSIAWPIAFRAFSSSHATCVTDWGLPVFATMKW